MSCTTGFFGWCASKGKRVTALVPIATPTRHRETKEITPQDTTQGMDPEPRTGKRLFKVKGCVRWCARRASLRPYPYASRFHAGRQKREREREKKSAKRGKKKRKCFFSLDFRCPSISPSPSPPTTEKAVSASARTEQDTSARRAALWC